MKVPSLLSYAAFLNYLMPVSALQNYMCLEKTLSGSIIQEEIENRYNEMVQTGETSNVNERFGMAQFYIKYKTPSKDYDVTISVEFTEGKEVATIGATIGDLWYACKPTNRYENRVTKKGPGSYECDF